MTDLMQLKDAVAASTAFSCRRAFRWHRRAFGYRRRYFGCVAASLDALAAPWNGHGSPPPAVAAAVEAVESPHGVQAPFEEVVSDEYCEQDDEDVQNDKESMDVKSRYVRRRLESGSIALRRGDSLIRPEVCWSSLPYELVRRIADTFVATNDIDWYINLCVVCHNWRESTDDPRSTLADPRFQPLGWVLFETPDAEYNGDSRHCTFVNVNIGRFLTKQLLIPRLSQCISSTKDGLLVFEEFDSSSKKATVFFCNPFTLGKTGCLYEAFSDHPKARAPRGTRGSFQE